MSASSSSIDIFWLTSARGLSVVTSIPSLGIAAARRRQHALALDLDHARPAVAVGPHAFHVAEARDLDAELLRGLEDRRSAGRPPSCR